MVVAVLEVLADAVRTVVLVVLLAVFVEMLLPSGDMARFVRLVMGLFVVAVVLGAVWQLVPGLGAVISGQRPEGVEEVSATGVQALQDYYREAAWQLMEEQVGRQVGALLAEYPQFAVLGVRVVADGEWSWGQIPRLRGLEVRLGPGEGLPTTDEVRTRALEEVKSRLAQSFGLSPERVEVRWQGQPAGRSE